MKDRAVTLSAQRAVANVLTAFMFAETDEDLKSVWKQFYDAYELMDDPFTTCPCAPKDYYKNQLKLEKQIMDEMYGHHERRMELRRILRTVQTKWLIYRYKKGWIKGLL